MIFVQNNTLYRIIVSLVILATDFGVLGKERR